jgi:ribosomal protein L5
MTEQTQTQENLMRKISIEKVTLSCGGTEQELEKGKKLLQLIAGKRKIQIIASRKRIPAFSVRPGLEVGARVTIRLRNPKKNFRGLK